MSETIEVQWLGTATKMLQELERISTRFDKQEAQLQKLATTSKKSADAAAGSFNKLEQELKDNEVALKKIEVGTKAFDAQKKKVDDLRKSLASTKSEMASAAGFGEKAIGTGIDKLAGLAVGLASINTIVNALVSELEKAKEIRLDSAMMAKSVEQALVDMAPNLAGLGPADQVLPEAKVIIEKTALDLGVDQVALANLVGVAVSAGANDLKQAIELSTIGLKLTAGDAQKAVTIVGGMLDIAGKANSKNFEGAMGQAFQSMGQARATNFAMFAENMGPGVAAATRDMPRMKGMTTEQALETISVFTQILGDQTGAKSSTILNQYFARLGDFVPQRSAKLDDGRTANVTQAEIDRFVAEKDYAKKKELMRVSPGIMDQFVDTQREGNAKGTIREFIEGSERVNQWLTKAEAAVTSLDDAAKVTQTFYGAIQDLAPAVTSSRMTGAVVQQQQIIAGKEGEVQAQLEAVLRENLPGLDMLAAPAIRGAVDINAASGMSRADATAMVLEKLLKEGFDSKPLSERTAAVAVSALEQVQKLDKLIELQEQQLALLRQQQGQPPRPVAAPATRPKEAPLPAATVP
jgi:tetrahydromethanopterin S-methyltransferase subunit G